MEKLFIAVGSAFGLTVLVFLLMIFSTLLSGVAGWIIGGVFPYVTDTLRELFGVKLTNFQIGATIGFFGSAFRSPSFSSKD